MCRSRSKRALSASSAPTTCIRATDGEPFRTDEDHYILDCALGPDADPDLLAHELEHVPGVMEHGLFIGMAERALLGRPDGGVDVLEGG